jgi:DNA polymerase III subunit epsilon
MAVYCFLDVETTGVNQVKNGIIQIGAVLCRKEAESLLLLEEICLNVAPFPGDVIDPEALAVSGVTEAQIADYPRPEVIHQQLLEVFGKYCNKFDKKDKMLFLGYNVSFDYGFLRRWFEKLGDKYFGSWFWHPPVDIMSVAMMHLAAVRHEMVDFKLGTVAARFGITMENAHNALSDARTTRAIFERVTTTY